jgi:hypothetical protein
MFCFGFTVLRGKQTKIHLIKKESQMLRKLIFAVSVVVAAVATALVFSGCSTVLKSNTLKGYTLEPTFESNVTVADLEVSEQKVMGTAKGAIVPPLVTKQTLIQEALTLAIQQKPGADVLVGVTYFYETAGRDMTVTITGYPARYKNFRTKTATEDSPRRADVIIEHRVSNSGGSALLPGQPAAHIAIPAAPAAGASEE